MVIELVLLTEEAVVMKSWMAAQYANVTMTLNSGKRKAPIWELYAIAYNGSLNCPVLNEPR